MKSNNKKNESIVILAPNNILDIYVEALKFSFGVEDIILVSDSESNDYRINIINEINDNKKVKKVIFFDYCYTFHQLIQKISNNKDKYIIIKNAVAEMTSSYIYDYIKYYFEYLDRGLVNKIAFLDPNFYLENNKKLVNLTLDVPKQIEKNKENSNFGVISYDFYEYHNFFNQICAIKKITNDSINIFNPCNITKEFCQDFDIKYKEFDTIEEIINNSKCLLYVNFCYDDNLYLLKCIDNKKVCVMGNFDFGEDFKYLNDTLVIKSDDDINEISNKLLNSYENREDLLNSLVDYRKMVSSLSKDQIANFLNEE